MGLPPKSATARLQLDVPSPCSVKVRGSKIEAVPQRFPALNLGREDLAHDWIG
jgi:hypothetical protein